MNIFRVFSLVTKSHPDADFRFRYTWSRRSYTMLNRPFFKASERKCLRDYLDGRHDHRMMTGERDQLNWYLYGINHGVYDVDVHITIPRF